MIDDTDEAATPSRVATPLSTEKDAQNKGSDKQDAAEPHPGGEKGEAAKEAIDQPENTGAAGQAAAVPTAADLPPEVRIRLRKLDKLEKTYPGSPFP